MSISVVIVDDHRIMREGLRSLIEQEMGIDVVGEADNGRTLMRVLQKKHPSVVLMDVSMSEMNGFQATCKIRSRFDRCKVIALSMYRDRQFVEGMLQAGASGYVLKSCSFDEVIRAIRIVAAGGTYLTPYISDVVVTGYLSNLNDKHGASCNQQPTLREREVLQLLAEGKTTEEIASLLHISAKTVGTHRQHMMKKLGFRNLADLVRFAVHKGIVTSDV